MASLQGCGSATDVGAGPTTKAPRWDQARQQGRPVDEASQLARDRGDAALKAERYAEALIHYETALQVDKDDLASRFALGVTLRRMRRFEDSKAVFDTIEKRDKEYPGLKLERGIYYEETGQLPQALALYSEALVKEPNDIDLKLRVGGLLVAMGRPAQAEPLLKEVRHVRADSAEAHYFLGRAHLATGSNKMEALRLLKHAIELGPIRAEYHLYYGFAANEAGHLTVADEALTQALRLDPDLGLAHWQRGVLRRKQDRILEAIEDLEIALAKQPSLYQAHATLALCYADQRDLAKAEQSWRAALAGDNENAEWHYRFGMLLERTHGTTGATPDLEREAVAHYAAFLRLSPPDHGYRKDAEARLEKLKPK